MKKIERDQVWHITNECMREMEKSLPVALYVNDDKQPAFVAKTKKDLARYFKPALPYCLTTRFKPV